MKKRITALLIAAVMLFSGMITVNAATTSSVIESTAESVGYSAARIEEFTGEATEITATTALSSASGNYVIKTQAGMDAFAAAITNETTKFAGCTVYLTVSGLKVDAPIGDANTGARFDGVFDGQGNTINLDMNATKTGTGLFSYLYNATVKNLVVTGNITVTVIVKGVGGIAGIGGKGAKIDNCMSMVNISATVTDSSTVAGYGCGGILGGIHTNGTTPEITNCTNIGSVTGMGAVGGILGETRNLYNEENGGLTVSNCVNYGTISVIDSGSTSITYNGTYAGCGGIVGYIRKSNNTDEIYTPAYANISGCYNYGAVSSAQSGDYKISGCSGIL